MARPRVKYFIPCFCCGVRNIVVPMLQIVGWRKDALSICIPQRKFPPFARERATARGQSRLVVRFWSDRTKPLGDDP